MDEAEWWAQLREMDEEQNVPHQHDPIPIFRVSAVTPHLPHLPSHEHFVQNTDEMRPLEASAFQLLGRS